MRAIARISIATGLGMFVFEVVRNWGDWQPWPAWVVDYICGSLLAVGGWLALRPLPRRSIGLMCGAWGFFLALLWGSFFGNLKNWAGKNNGPIPQKVYTIMIGGFLLYAAVMFFWCMATTRAAERERV